MPRISPSRSSTSSRGPTFATIRWGWSRPWSAERSPGHMSRILVVEDEPAIAELIAINLRHAGFEVTVAGDADAAQEAVNGILPTLVVVDWMLPGRSGHALVREWRAAPRTRAL